jgi:hypothetical protein
MKVFVYARVYGTDWLDRPMAGSIVVQSDADSQSLVHCNAIAASACYFAAVSRGIGVTEGYHVEIDVSYGLPMNGGHLLKPMRTNIDAMAADFFWEECVRLSANKKGGK